MPDQYPDFHAGQSASVSQASTDHSLDSSYAQELSDEFTAGVYGDPTSVVAVRQEASAAAAQCNADGVTWRASNPDKPIPPKPY